jgi:hypothetical protein
MPSTTSQRATIVPSSAPSTPRLSLTRIRAARAVLDGGWWPRSVDPEAELPGLVIALSARYGRVRQVMLNSGTWSTDFHRLAVGADVVQIGWFAGLDPALLIATTDRGDQVDLLVVPPATATGVAEHAMAAAADPSNVMRAAALLAATTAGAGNDDDPDPSAILGSDGGHIRAATRELAATDIPTIGSN